MSKLEVDAIEPQSGTTLTLGASGDAVNIASGASITDFKSTGIDDNATANALTLDSSGNLQFNSGYGSVATAYGCRAWVNFNGSNPASIRESGNVTSITQNGTGDYTVNFTTNMPDTNYCAVLTANAGGGNGGKGPYVATYNVSSLRVYTYDQNGSFTNYSSMNCAIFR
jgi:hypothetical protein